MRHDDHFRIRSLTERHRPFFISWVIIFIWLYSYFLPFGGFKFASELYSLKVGDELIFTLAWLLISPLIAWLAPGRKYTAGARYSVIGALAAFLALRYTGPGLASTLILLGGSACIGHIFISCCYAYFMVLNNTEKFYGMLLAVLAPKLLLLAKPLLNHPAARFDGATGLIFILIIVLLLASRRFEKALPAALSEAERPPLKAYSLMILVFAVLALNDVIAPALVEELSGGTDAGAAYYVGGVLAGAAFVLAYEKLRRTELYHMINLSFGIAALGFVASGIGLRDPFYARAAYVLFGCSYAIGMINIYYLAGFLAKKLRSAFFFRMGITLSSLFYILAIAADRLRQGFGPAPGALTAMAFAAVMILVGMLVLTPFFVRHLSSREWMDDSYREDITTASRLNACLAEYHLSPRECEAAGLLMRGLTLRQIGAEMKISFSTVNTYCNNIYRKLGINSRTELLVRLRDFGEPPYR